MPQVSKHTLGMSNFFGHGGGPAEEEIGDKADRWGKRTGTAYFSSQKSVKEAVEGTLQTLVGHV